MRQKVNNNINVGEGDCEDGVVDRTGSGLRPMADITKSGIIPMCSPTSVLVNWLVNI
jgi:hypothetical protein